MKNSSKISNGVKKITLLFILLILIGFSLALIQKVKAAAAVPTPPPGVTGTCKDWLFLGEEPKPPEEEKEPILEVKYPEIGGVKPVAEGEDALPQFIKYIFMFGVSIAGLIAFVALVYGGVRYLTSAGSPTALSDAKSQITAGILGLIILLASFLILNTINPRLTKLTLKSVADIIAKAEQIEGLVSGVYLIDESQDDKDIVKIEKDGKILKFRRSVATQRSISNLASPTFNFDNKTDWVCFNTDWREDIKYNAILHEEPDFKGECRIVLKNDRNIGELGPGEEDYGGKVEGVSSVHVFVNKILFPEEPQQDFAVRFYKSPGFYDDPDEPNDVCTIKKEQKEPKDIDTCPGGDWNDNVHSLEVGEGYVLSVFEEENASKKCEVFGSGKIAEVRTHYIGRCKVGFLKELPFFGQWKPCISSFSIYQGRLQ